MKSWITIALIYTSRKDEERIFKDYIENPADTVRIDREVIRLQNTIVEDSSRFCTIYLDTTFTRKSRGWIGVFPYPDKFGARLRKAVYEVSNDTAQVFNVVGSLQTSYQAEDFTLCSPCCVGVIRLSKSFLIPTRQKDYYIMSLWAEAEICLLLKK